MSTQLIKPNYLVILPTDAAPQFLEKLYSLFIYSLFLVQKCNSEIVCPANLPPLFICFLSVNIFLVKPSQILSCCGSGCNGLVLNLLFDCMNTQTILQMDDKKTKKLIYPEHLPLTKIQAGLKSGKYLQVYNSHSYMLLL